MGYVPKFIYFNHIIAVDYPFGINWKHTYIKQSAKIISETYKEDIKEGVSITFVVRGTSGAMIGGALINELYNIDSSIKSYLIVVRKNNDNAHCSSLRGIDEVGDSKIIIVDDFISSGETIQSILSDLDCYFEVLPHPSIKYDMLCISNIITKNMLKKNTYDKWNKWKNICSRFEYVICCPEDEE